MLLLVIITVAVKAQVTGNYTGIWNFKAPSAPEGYVNGIIELKKDTAIISFNDVPYSFVSEWVKVRKDSLFFETYINSGSVLFSLKLEADSIKGNAVWSDGESDISLTKEAKKD